MNNVLVMEYHAHDVEWWGDLVVGEPTIVGGFIQLDDKPGSSFFGDDAHA